MKISDNVIINTHFYLEENEKLSDTIKSYHTIDPSVIKKALDISNIISILPDNDFLITLKMDHTIDSKKPLYSYIQLEDLYMVQSIQNNDLSIYEWLQLFWNKKFLVTNPIYEIKDFSNLYIFSNRYTQTLKIPVDTNSYDYAISEGCFSIGNGIIFALSLVANKTWNEKDFLEALEILVNNDIHPIDEGISYFYTFLEPKWLSYISVLPYHIFDLLFKYSFMHNSKRVYQYVYSLTNECVTVFYINGMSNIYLNSVYNSIQTVEQEKFMYENYTLYSAFEEPFPYHRNVLYFNYYQKVSHILANRKLFNYYLKNFENTTLYEHIAVYKKFQLLHLIKTLSVMYHTLPVYRKRLLIFWRKIIEICKDNILVSMYIYLLQGILKNTFEQDPYTIVPGAFMKGCIYNKYSSIDYYKPIVHSVILKSSKIMKHLPANISYKYDESNKKLKMYCNWKTLLETVDLLYKTSYEKFVSKKIIKHLKKLYHITSTHEDQHLLIDLMKEYYLQDKHRLWK